MATRPLITKALASVIPGSWVDRSHKKTAHVPLPAVAEDTDELCLFNPECWEKARVRGMCPACYSSFRRLQKYGVKDLMKYARRVQRFGSRSRYLLARQGKAN